MLYMIFFFFQAEDGIRDIGVTGVQTCALPIFSGSMETMRVSRCSPSSTIPSASAPPESPVPAPRGTKGTFASRSEERRVGKSVDLGGRRIIKKKHNTKQVTHAHAAKHKYIYRS